MEDWDGDGVKDVKRRATLLVATMGVVLGLLSGVALAANAIRCELDTPCVGTEGDDEMHGATSGTGGIDVMHGKAGNDVMYGYLYPDFLYGERGNDTLYGGVHHDELWGGADDDNLYGSLGRDRLLGGAGADDLYGDDPYDYELREPPLRPLFYTDVLRGGDGPDWVYAQDGILDIIDCGEGNDSGYWDAEDIVDENCETNLGADPPPQ